MPIRHYGTQIQVIGVSSCITLLQILDFLRIDNPQFISSAEWQSHPPSFQVWSAFLASSSLLERFGNNWHHPVSLMLFIQGPTAIRNPRRRCRTCISRLSRILLFLFAFMASLCVPSAASLSQRHGLLCGEMRGYGRTSTTI